MSDLIERVARAICMNTMPEEVGVATTSFYDPDFIVPARALPKIRQDTPRWKFFVPQAMAAINAMREPTEAMIDAGDVWADAPGYSVKVLNAMIDVALSK